ncbi:GNAT family N-acetyltransferase [Rapidithrix thailandica]|uniref:GNAT family N-acetyltransferase n=1 Tax=Rapidithrix thailandica TaxID=413964 RepID=A0AAW9SHD0_9BACT
MEITYKQITPDTPSLIDLFNHSDYFPIKEKHDTKRIAKMFEKANLVISAWHNETLVGISRSLTDFCYCCYLSDLAVRDDYKRKGIGKKLVELTKEKAGDQCKLILQSSPGAMEFYTSIGMDRIDSAFIIQREI